MGGFGQSECLLKCLKGRFATESTTSQCLGMQSKLEVLQPPNAWTAVVRGAVLRGLEGAELVLNRKARRHYGVRCSRHFDARIHPASCKYWDVYDECYMANDRMSWYIEKGQTVPSNERILFPFSQKFSLHGDRRTTIELVACDNDIASEGFESGINAATKVVCEAVVNLDSVPAHLWANEINSAGLRYRELDYRLGMQVESGRLRFDLRVDGVVYGSVEATFDRDTQNLVT